MAQRPNTRPASRPPAAPSLDAAREAEASTEALLSGRPADAPGKAGLSAAVQSIARRVSATHARLNSNSTLETMARIRQDSLLQTPLVPTPGSPSTQRPGALLQDALNNIEATMINDIFFAEKRRVDDYITYRQIYELVTQASEAVQTYTDNIISPDDFTKRDINAFYTGPDETDTKIADHVSSRMKELTRKYSLDDRIEEAIMRSLTAGDYFIAVLNLRQELEGVLTEDGGIRDLTDLHRLPLHAQHVPPVGDPDMMALTEEIRGDVGKGEIAPDDGQVRAAIASYISSFVTFNETAETLTGRLQAAAQSFAQDIDYRRLQRGVNRTVSQQPNAGRPSLARTAIRGSVLKMIPPENVIKLYQDDTLFGYYYVEVTGQNIADFGRNTSGDQAAVVRSLDQNLAARAFGTSTGTGPENSRDRLISRIIVRTLASRLGKASFLADHEEFAADAYAILSRAKREGKRVNITYVASDQMVHFSPNGGPGYGDSVLSRVKFIAKLYIGAITNAFMRNSIRRAEKLVWYLDVGADNDGSNAVQTFIRTIKQNEVKFSNLRDISTTINHVGEFHDFYIPTYNGERPVEVETLNMGPAGEVDSDFLNYLRKEIISGMGVPAAFLGYSEEIAFARSLTMDNGRFLRRVIRHQKHYGAAATQLTRILWRNEYSSLEELIGKKAAQDGKKVVAGSGEGGKDKPNSKDGDETREDGQKESDLDETTVSADDVEVRFPSPATLNMTNIADSINQALPVIDGIAGLMTEGESEPTKAAFKLGLAREQLPQLHWDRYEKILEAARRVGERAEALKPPDALLSPGGEDPDGGGGDLGTPGPTGSPPGTGPEGGQEEGGAAANP